MPASPVSRESCRDDGCAIRERVDGEILFLRGDGLGVASSPALILDRLSFLDRSAGSPEDDEAVFVPRPSPPELPPRLMGEWGLGDFRWGMR